MRRMLAAIKLDATVQWRNKLYWLGGALSVAFGLAAGAIAPRETLRLALPVLFLAIIGGTGLLYAIGLIIFEKDDGTLDAALVSPLQPREYVISKVVTLMLLSLVEGVLLVILAWGVGEVRWEMLLAGMALMSVILSLVGCIVGARYDAVTDALMPVILIALLLELPFLYFTQLAPSPIWLVIPTAAPAMLIWAAWHPFEPWQVLYGFIYSALWIALLYRLVMRAFYRSIILRQ